MPLNSFGHLFRVTTWGESHGPALGAVVDGCPPGIPLEAPMLQRWLDRRKPGQNKYTTQRREADEVEILSGVFEGQTTGHPVQLMIRNEDQRSKDYGEIADKFRPGHADITYWQKYGIRDYRGGGRSSARETAARVAAGAMSSSCSRWVSNSGRPTTSMRSPATPTALTARSPSPALRGHRTRWLAQPVSGSTRRHSSMPMTHTRSSRRSATVS